VSKRFYALLLGDGKRRVVECRIDEIDARLSELGAVKQGEGDSREEALAQAAKANPGADWYSGSSSLPMPK
jgi:hypothetical protein